MAPAAAAYAASAGFQIRKPAEPSWSHPQRRGSDRYPCPRRRAARAWLHSRSKTLQARAQPLSESQRAQLTHAVQPKSPPRAARTSNNALRTIARSFGLAQESGTVVQAQREQGVRDVVECRERASTVPRSRQFIRDFCPDRCRSYSRVLGSNLGLRSHSIVRSNRSWNLPLGLLSTRMSWSLPLSTI